MSAVDDGAFRRLLQVGRTVVSDLDVDAVLERVLGAAREVTGARYAALGVLDEQRRELGRFVTAGLDAGTRRLIGAAPKGRGVRRATPPTGGARPKGRARAASGRQGTQGIVARETQTKTPRSDAEKYGSVRADVPRTSRGLVDWDEL